MAATAVTVPPTGDPVSLLTEPNRKPAMASPSICKRIKALEASVTPRKRLR